MKAALFFILLSSCLFMEMRAENLGKDPFPSTSSCCTLGAAGYLSMPNGNYSVETFPFPQFVPLSKHRNEGFTQGQVKLKKNGIKINKAGNYAVNFSVTLKNPLTEESVAPSFFVALAIDGKATISPFTISVANIPSSTTFTVPFSGILENVKPGTTLSLQILNGGELPQPVEIIVISWKITVERITCCND